MATISEMIILARILRDIEEEVGKRERGEGK